MPTNPIGEGKTVVSASVPIALANEITRRAARLKWTKSKYASELFQKWYDAGCPALNKVEAASFGDSVYQIFCDSSPMADAAAGKIGGPVTTPDDAVRAAEFARRRGGGNRQQKTS